MAAQQGLLMPAPLPDGWESVTSVYDMTLQPTGEETVLSVSSSTVLNHPTLTVFLKKKMPFGGDGWAQLSVTVTWDWSFTSAQIVFGPSEELRQLRFKLSGEVKAVVPSHQHQPSLQVPQHAHPEITVAPGCTVLDKDLQVVSIEGAITDASMEYGNGVLGGPTASLQMKMYPNAAGSMSQIPIGQTVKGLIFTKPQSSPGSFKTLTESLAAEPPALPVVSKKDFTNGVFYVQQKPDPPIVGVAYTAYPKTWQVWVGEGAIAGNVGGWAVLKEGPTNPMAVALTVKAKKSWKSTFAPKQPGPAGITATFPDGTTQSKPWSSELSDPLGDVQKAKKDYMGITANLAPPVGPVLWKGAPVGQVTKVVKLPDQKGVEATIKLDAPDKIMTDLAAKFGFTDGAAITYDGAFTNAIGDSTAAIMNGEAVPKPSLAKGMKVVLDYVNTPLAQLEPEGTECQDGMAYFDATKHSTQVWLNGEVHDVPGKPYDVMWLKP